MAEDYAQLVHLLETERPDTIVHFAEQRAAPYSMRGAAEKRYTVGNNVGGTHNVLGTSVVIDRKPLQLEVWVVREIINQEPLGFSHYPHTCVVIPKLNDVQGSQIDEAR